MSKKCFFITPIGDEGTWIRKRSDQVFHCIIEPAAKECDYDTTRSDLIPNPGIITHQIIEHLFSDGLVIADLSYNNVNVIYELALRHAFIKPVIQIKDSEDNLPFDIQGMRTINFDFRFVVSMEKCKSDIVKQIKAIESDPDKIESPVTYTLDYHSMEKKDADSRSILLESQVQTLFSEIHDLKRWISRPSIQVSGLGSSFFGDVSGRQRISTDIPPPPSPPPPPKSDTKDEDK